MPRWKHLLVVKNNKVESLLDKLAWRVNLPTLRFLPGGHQSNNCHFDDPPTVQLNLHQPRSTRPFIFRAEHCDREFGRIRIRHNAAFVEVLARLFDLHVADQRSVLGMRYKLTLYERYKNFILDVRYLLAI
jgi:hypothetical protein